MSERRIIHDRHYKKYAGIAISYDSRAVPFNMPNPHFHSDFELFYLVKGSRKFLVEDNICSLIDDSLMLIKPGVAHQSTFAANTPMERYAVYISSELIDEIVADLGMNFEMTNMFFLTLSENGKKSVFENILRLCHEFSLKDTYSPLIIKSIVSEIILLIIREKNNSVQIQTTDNFTKNDKYMQNVIDFIRENYAEKISVEVCSGIAYMSPSHFSRQFKRVTSHNFKDYVNIVRVEKACELLKNTEKNITEIALEVGFLNSNYFSFVFKSKMSMTPLKYRKSSKREIKKR